MNVEYSAVGGSKEGILSIYNYLRDKAKRFQPSKFCPPPAEIFCGFAVLYSTKVAPADATRLIEQEDCGLGCII